MRRSATIFTALFATLAVLGLGACSSDDDSASKKNDAKSSQTRDDQDGKSDTEDTDDADSSPAGESVDLSGDGAEYAAAMVASMMEGDDVPLTEDQANCYATRTVDLIGVDRFKKAGVTPDALRDGEPLDYSTVAVTEDEANKIFDQFKECGVDLRSAMLKSFEGDASLSAKAKDCFNKALTEENLRVLLVDGMINGGDAMSSEGPSSEVLGQIMACSFMDMEGEGVTPPTLD